MVSAYPIKTLNMMAHIRYATQGAVSLENVHPFTREMWGINWTFAHNGEVPKFTTPKTNPQEENSCNNNNHNFCVGTTTDNIPMLGKCVQAVYHPVGETDSEAVFCAMLNALRAEFTTLPTLPVLYEAIQRLCCEIVRGHEEKTIFNFLLGCGQFTMFAFSWPGSRDGSTVWNGLHYLVRWPPFSTAVLKDVDYAVDFSETNGEMDRVAIIATKPLTTNEKWKEFKKGELLMVGDRLFC
jgi:glutamine amidotransferase